MSHEPKHYNLPDHLAKIFRSPEFAAAAKQAEKSHESFQNEVGEALKKVVGEFRAAELAEFEHHLQAQALTAALAKFKTDVEHELKGLVAKARDVELRAHEDALTPRAIQRAKANKVV